MTVRLNTVSRMLSSLCIGLTIACASTSLQAQTVMRAPPELIKGSKADFNGIVITEALNRTQKTYGPYKLASGVPNFPRDRLLEEMIRGEEVNLAAVPTQPGWEEKLIPIRIPVDMGLSGYRIALAHRDSQEKISAVKKLSDLQGLTLGVVSNWPSRKVFDAAGFNVVTADTYAEVLNMALWERADIFPRNLSEVLAEYDANRADNPPLIIEKDILIAMPQPTYIFVSPKAARLAKRIEEGMESMVADGTLLKMVLSANAIMLDRTKLCSRRLFSIKNPLLSDKTPFQRKELWLNPLDANCAAKKP